MKKILSLLLCAIMILSVSGCGSDNNKTETKLESTENQETPATPDPQTKVFNKLADDISNVIDEDKDISELKQSVENLKKDIQAKVTAAAEDDKSGFDTQQIAVFMMEQAIKDYESAKSEGNEEKITQAKSALETAKKIWSSRIKK